MRIRKNINYHKKCVADSKENNEILGVKELIRSHSM